MRRLSRRVFLGSSIAAAAGALLSRRPVLADDPPATEGHAGHGGAVVVSDGAALPATPAASLADGFLTHFDSGRPSTLPDGRTLREYELVAEDREIEVAAGVKFAAWTYNGTAPGPTLRCTEGDLLRIHFRNDGAHPHTVHFHGVHPANMDGVHEVVAPGFSYTYEFTADPFGVHPYHCHVMPLKRHIHKGLYGTLIIDPPGGRPPAHEMVMVMNGFDLDQDGENEFYTVNGVAFYYQHYPIRIKVGELVRIYLTNMTEFDLINSFHLHANMFRYYPTGTSLSNPLVTDTVTLGQGERGILEFAYKLPGQYMFHAHQSEFAELGWMGLFEVVL